MVISRKNYWSKLTLLIPLFMLGFLFCFAPSGASAATLTKTTVTIKINRDQLIFNDDNWRDKIDNISVTLSKGSLTYSTISTKTTVGDYFVLSLDISRCNSPIVDQSGWNIKVFSKSLDNMEYDLRDTALCGNPFFTIEKTPGKIFSFTRSGGTECPPCPNSGQASTASPTTTPTPAATPTTASGLTATANCPATGIYAAGLLKGIPCNEPLSDINAVVTLAKNLVLDYILPLVGTLFIIMLLIGGILYITSRGDKTQLDRGKKTLTAAIIGLLIVILSYTIIAVFAKAIGGGIS